MGDQCHEKNYGKVEKRCVAGKRLPALLEEEDAECAAVRFPNDAIDLCRHGRGMRDRLRRSASACANRNDHDRH
jgi:hypothetical protein